MNSTATQSSNPSRWRVGLRSHIITLLGLILFGLLTYILITTQTRNIPTFDDKAAMARLERLQKLREEEKTKLTTYGWIDREAGLVHIPIEKAIPIALRELKKKPVRAGSPITTPPIPSPAPPAPSTSPDTLTAAPSLSNNS